MAVTSMEDFFNTLKQSSPDEALLDFCRKFVLHGTPIVFEGRDHLFYEFRKRIASEYKINFHEIFIVGSAKLGFSPHKKKAFSLDSDVDVAIVSSKLFEEIMSTIHGYQMELRNSRKTVSEAELKQYHSFLEYSAIGWVRPDLLPTSFRVSELKDKWFSFFDSISNGKSEVGNYKVAAGVFKSYFYLESYHLSGVRKIKTQLEVEENNV